MSLRKSFRRLVKKVAPIALTYFAGGSTAVMAAAMSGGTASKLTSMLAPVTRSGASDALLANFFPEVLQGAAVGAVTGLPGGAIGAGVGAAVGGGVAAVEQIASGDYPFDTDDEYADDEYDDGGDYDEEDY